MRLEILKKLQYSTETIKEKFTNWYHVSLDWQDYPNATTLNDKRLTYDDNISGQRQ